MVLGISPGTRTIGISVLVKGKLTIWKLFSFPQKWTDAKREKIVNTIARLIQKYNIAQVAIKIPDELPISSAYIQLVGALNVLCEQLGTQPQYFTLSELKQGYFPDRKVNKQALIQYLISLYPDLHLFASKQQGKDKKYHDKVYEATGVARLTYLYTNLPN